jgi:hypothetical protein
MKVKIIKTVQTVLKKAVTIKIISLIEYTNGAMDMEHFDIIQI